MSEKRKPKKSSVRHTRAIQRERSQRPNSAPPDETVRARLTDLVHPATYAQMAAFRAMGLRERILTLPVMMAFVLSLIWQHLGSVAEAVRVLCEEGMLWVEPVAVSQQAVVERLGSLPAELFQRVLEDVLPRMHERWQARTRPLSPALRWAQEHFTAVMALDGSTLDVVLRKTGLLRDAPQAVLAGRMAALLDVITRLPRQVWYEENAQAHDQRFWEPVWATLQPGLLLLFDLGFVNYAHFDTLTDQGIWFLTRALPQLVYRTDRVLHTSAQVHDLSVWIGARQEDQCRHPMRLIEIEFRGKWYRYLTNVLDPRQLPAALVAGLYAQRWRIEDAFNVIKRLLGLAYFWTGSINGVMVQVWATWILYAALIDLTDAVAEALRKPFQDISIEMVYRGLYHFTQAHQRGSADDPVAYLATKAKRLGIVKRKRKQSAWLGTPFTLTNPTDP
jgi:hypothetical protein